LNGLSADVAGTQLAHLGLKGTPKTVPGSAPEGTVVAPDPAAGTTVGTGSAVHCNFSNGKKTEMLSVPQLVGLSRYDAQAQLDQVGLSDTVYVVPSDEKVGYVVAQDPPGVPRSTRGERALQHLGRPPAPPAQTGRSCQQRQSSIRPGGSVRRRRSGSRHTVIRRQRRDSFTVRGRALRHGLLVDRLVAA
jgi:hypothetical protein